MEGGVVVWPNAPAIQIKLVAAHMEAVTAPAIRIRTVVPQRRLSRVLRSAPCWPAARLGRGLEEAARGGPLALPRLGARLEGQRRAPRDRRPPQRVELQLHSHLPAPRRLAPPRDRTRGWRGPPGAAAAGRAFSGALRRFAPV